MAQHTQSAGQCAALCASDAACVAWTRVAGGRSDVRSCHLKRTLSGLVGPPEASVSVQQHAQVGTSWQSWPFGSPLPKLMKCHLSALAAALPAHDVDVSMQQRVQIGS